MKLIVTIIFCIFISGCNVFMGVAVREVGDETWPEGEENPIGTIRAEKDFSERLRGYVQHDSSIPGEDVGYNRVGLELRIK